MDWLRRAAGAVGNAFNQGASFVARNNPVSQSYNIASRAANDARRRLLEQQRAQQQAQQRAQQQAQINAQQRNIVPKLNLNAAMNALGKIGNAANPVNQFKAQADFANKNVFKPLNNLGESQLAKQYGISRQQLNDVKNKSVLDRAKFGIGNTVNSIRSNPGTAIARSPFSPAMGTGIVARVLNSAPVNIPKIDTSKSVQNIGESISRSRIGKLAPVGLAGEYVVKPVVSQIARNLDVVQGQKDYDKGTKGLSQLASDAFTMGSLLYTPAKAGATALAVKQGGLKAGAKFIPGALARGFGSGVAVNALYQGGERGIRNIDPREALMAGGITGLANAGLPFAPGLARAVVGKGNHIAPNLNAPVIAKNLADKGRLRAEGYTNVKVGKIAPPSKGIVNELKDNIEGRLAVKGVANTRGTTSIDNLVSYEGFKQPRVDFYKRQIQKNGIDSVKPLNIEANLKGKATVLDGNNRLEALRQLGIRNVPITSAQVKTKFGRAVAQDVPTSKIHPEDQRVMMDFIDFNKSKYRPNPAEAHELQIAASRIMERYNLPHPEGKAVKSTGDIANVFQHALEQADVPGRRAIKVKAIAQNAPLPEPKLPKGFKVNSNGDVINAKTGKVATPHDLENAIAGKNLSKKELLNFDQKTADMGTHGRIGAPIYETAPLPNKGTGMRTGLSKSLEKKGFKQEIYDDIPGYTKIENKTFVDDSLKRIKSDESGVMRAILNRKRDTPISAQMNSDAVTLMNKLAKEGRDDELGKLAKATALNATEAGRAVQILSRLQALTPEGALTRAQNLIAKYNEKFAKNNKDLVLTKENERTIIKMAKDIQKLEDGTRDHDVAAAMLAKYIDSLVPPSKLAKISSIQTMAQLLNPKTAIRNIVGNAAMSVGEDLSTATAAPVDILISGLQRLSGNKGQRTVGMINPLNRIKGTAQGAVWGTQDALKGIKTSGLAGNFEITTNVFRGAQKGDNIIQAAAKNGMKGAQTLLSLELGAADKAFYNGQFKTSLGSMMRAGKVKKPDKWMLQQADAEALYSTFQNNSRIAEALAGTKKWLNVQKEWGLGDIVVKYPKTPGNIVSVGLDYSPVGALKGVYSLVKNWGRLDKVTQREAARNIGRSIVGTGAIGLGAMLAYNKIITGKKSADRDMAAVDRQQGDAPFTFNFTALQRLIAGENTEAQKGDVIANYDWMQPSAIALSMGANAVLNGGSKQRKWENVFGDALEAVGDSVNTVIEQPVVTGISRFINTASTPDRGGGFGTAFANLFQGVPASFTPGILNQVGQLTDNVARSTYDPDFIKTGINQVKARIPGLRETLQPRIDSMGNQQEQYADGGNNVFNVFFNPAFVKTFKTSPAYDLINSIFKNTGDTQQAPRVTSNEVTINGVKRNLTAEESTKYQQYVGKLTQDVFNKMGTDPKFLSLPDSEKASRMATAMTEANQVALYDLFGNRPKNGTLGVDQRRILSSGQVSYNSNLNDIDSKASYKEKYQKALEDYQQNKRDGLISDIGDITAQKSLKKLSVQANFDQNTNDLYSLSNKEIDAYLSAKPNGGGMFNQLLALDDALVSQGFSSKFRDKYGRIKSMNGAKYAKGKRAKIARSKAPKLRSIKIARGSVPKISKTPRLKLRSFA